MTVLYFVWELFQQKIFIRKDLNLWEVSIEFFWVWVIYEKLKTSMISWTPKNWEDWLGATLQLKSIFPTPQHSDNLLRFDSGQIPSAIIQWTYGLSWCKTAGKEIMEVHGNLTLLMNSFLPLLFVFSPTNSTTNKAIRKINLAAIFWTWEQ